MLCSHTHTLRYRCSKVADTDTTATATDTVRSEADAVALSAVRATSVIKGELLNFYCVIFIIVMPWAWARVCSGLWGLETGDCRLAYFALFAFRKGNGR